MPTPVKKTPLQFRVAEINSIISIEVGIFILSWGTFSTVWIVVCLDCGVLGLRCVWTVVCLDCGVFGLWRVWIVVCLDCNVFGL